MSGVLAGMFYFCLQSIFVSTPNLAMRLLGSIALFELQVQFADFLLKLSNHLGVRATADRSSGYDTHLPSPVALIGARI